MLLKKIGAKNYFIAMFILLAITILLVISAFIMTAFLPESTGRPPYEYETISMCEFEPWAFENKGLEVNFPQGGIILNIKQDSRYRSDLLLGEGIYSHNGKTIDSETAGGIFLVTDYSYFEEIRGSNIFMPVEDETLQRQLTGIVDKQKGIPTIWKNTIPLAFHNQGDLAYYYFVTPDGEPALPPTTIYRTSDLLGSFLIYIIFIIIIFLVITMLSPDHRYSRYWLHLGNTAPGLFSLVIIPLIAALLAANKIVVAVYMLSELYLTFGYILILIILIFSANKGKIDYLDLGMRREKFINGYLLAIVSAVLIASAVRGFPSGFNVENVNTLLQLPVLFLLLALPRELIWRGYIQAFLSRWVGVNKGLLVMALFAAASHFGYLMYTEPWLAGYAYTYLEVFVLVPGTAALLGYLYLRTENIFACALLHSLILWLPGILTY